MINNIKWIIWLLIFILSLISYNKNPIKYSNKQFLFTNYNNLYFIIYISLLTLQIIHVHYLTIYHKFIDQLQPFWYYIFILIGTISIISMKKKPVIDDGTFIQKPSRISKKKRTLITIYIILLGLLITSIIIDNPINLNKSFYSPLIQILIIIYLLQNINSYIPCKYNLPTTWNL